MTEIYLRLVNLILTPLIIVVAILLFLRGHDLPGGGFIAGLLVAAALELTILARGATVTREQYGAWLIPLVATIAALLGIYGGGFFHGMWIEFYLGGDKIKMGTPQLFDLGVMLVVIGMAVTYLLRLSEAAEQVTGNDAVEGEQP